MKLIQKTLISTSIMLLLFSGLHAGFEKGDKEINFGFGLSHLSSDDSDSTSIAGNILYGYFQSENLELIGGINASHVDFDHGDSTAYGLTAGARWHFATSESFVPFVGARIGYQRVESGSFEEDDFIYRGEGGFRQQINENLTIDYIVSYERSSELETNNFAFSIGFGIFL